MTYTKKTIGRLKTIRIIPIPDKTELQFHLVFPSSAKREPIVFDVDFDDALRLMHALRHLQAQYKIPIPPNLRPFGKPKLAVVRMDDD